MPRPKGSPKYGGRKPGTPNKRPSALRQLIQNFCEEHFDDYIDTMEKIKVLKPEVYVREFGNALRFCTPMLQAIDAKLEGSISEEQKTVEQKLADLAASIKKK